MSEIVEPVTENVIKDLELLYENFDKTFKVRKENKYASLVNFSEHKDLPFQRWHYYQEGYSPDLVFEVFQSLGIKKEEAVILDPFVGSGTTLVSAQNMGVKSIGLELNPFSYFMATAKTRKYSKNSIRIARIFSLPKYKTLPDVYSLYELSIIAKLYSPESLSKIELLKQSIDLIDDLGAKTILKAALFSILESCSNYKKGGNGLKKKKKPLTVDVFEEFENKKNIIIEDIENRPNIAPVDLHHNNVKNLDELIENESIDLSIFSPPYANCFDYFEVYKIELWLGNFVNSYKNLRELRKTALTSNLNANLKQEVNCKEINSIMLEQVIELIKPEKLWDKRIPTMLLLYFKEMQEVITQLYKKQKPSSFVAIVIGNSAYSGVPVATDLILSEIATNSGFEVIEIIVARNNETSSQQYKKIGELVRYIRESIIILKKS